MTRPLLDLWRERSRTAISPDTVVLLAPVGEPYLIAFEREGCLLGLLPVPRGSFHRVLAIRLGKVA